MKEMEIKNLKSLGEFLPLKNTMITQILISVSIISLVFSLSSPTLLYNQNLHYYFSHLNYSFHLMSIAMNKNYIFLIFNGILVLLAKTSAPPPAPEPHDMLHKSLIANEGFQVLEIAEAETLISDIHTTSLEESPLSTENDEDEDEENEDEDTRGDQESEHSNERAVKVLIAIDEDGREDDENELQNCCLFDGRDQGGSNGGEEVDEEIEKMSNEELNKKFEDFIRRMKEEFRINQYQQKQLVLVK